MGLSKGRYGHQLICFIPNIFASNSGLFWRLWAFSSRRLAPRFVFGQKFKYIYLRFISEILFWWPFLVTWTAWNDWTRLWTWPRPWSTSVLCPPFSTWDSRREQTRACPLSPWQTCSGLRRRKSIISPSRKPLHISKNYLQQVMKPCKLSVANFQVWSLTHFWGFSWA